MKVYTSAHNPTLKLVWFDNISDRPNLTAYLAMKQDYSPDPIYLEFNKLFTLSEQELGERVYRLAVKFNHWGVLEHSGLIFNVVGFPHEVAMQHRTHRVGVSFDVQSQRYTGKHFLDYYQKESFFDDPFIRQYFYLDVIGKEYFDREGKSYLHNDYIENIQLNGIRQQLTEYVTLLGLGVPEERARRSLTQSIRQNYIFSCNPRSLLHLLDVRSPNDVQLEFRWLSELFMEFFENFNPVLSQEYKNKRYQKNKLSP